MSPRGQILPAFQVPCGESPPQGRERSGERPRGDGGCAESRVGVGQREERSSGKVDSWGERREIKVGLLVTAFRAPKGLQWFWAERRVRRKLAACGAEFK